MKQPVSFAALTVSGLFIGTPSLADAGAHRFVVAVSDGSFSSEATVVLSVKAKPLAAHWLQNPIRLRAKANADFNESLMAYAQNVDAPATAFVRMSGPPRLGVAVDGELFGTPTTSSFGSNFFEIAFRTAQSIGESTTVLVEVVE